MKKHILLIENDEIKLDFFSDALEESNLDFICSRARNVAQAAKYLKTQYRSLPKYRDFHSLKKIKTMDCFKSTPVVFYSATFEQNTEDALNSGASNYILFP